MAILIPISEAQEKLKQSLQDEAKGLYVITQSDVKAWLECQQRFVYSRIENLQPRRPAVPLVRGSLLHELLQAKAEGTTPDAVVEKYESQYGKIFKEEREYFGDLIGESVKIYEGYLKHWKDEPLNYHLVEHQVGPIRLTNKTAFTGKVDGLAEAKNLNWLVEHKSHKKFPDEQFRLSNLQSIIYTHGLRKEGYQVDGILWDYLRTKLPTVPDKLKNGRLSVAKRIDTTYAVYRQAIKDNGEDPKDPYYADILADLKMRPNQFYRRVYLPVNDTMVEEVLKIFKRASLQILRHQEKPARNMGKNCGWCPFKSLCLAEMRGHDSTFIREAEYVPRELRYSDMENHQEDSGGGEDHG